jgi:GntR family transcriptional regulator
MKIIKDPIYQQLNNILKELITKGEFKPGDQFLTERKICERFDVSRATANKALSNLVSENILEFKKGVGTFVADKYINFDLRTLISFTNITKSSGKNPSTKVLKFKKLSASKVDVNIINDLKISKEENVYYIERLRLIDGIPTILERRYVAEKYCPDIKKSSLEGSLYAVWVDEYKLKISGSTQIIKSIVINKDDVKILGANIQEAGFLVSAVGYLENEVPLWIEKTLFRGKYYEFRNRLGPVSIADSGHNRMFINT